MSDLAPRIALRGVERHMPRTTYDMLIALSDDELAQLDAKRLKKAEDRVAYALERDAKGFPFLRDLRWSKAFRRAWWMLEHKEKRANGRKYSIGDPKLRLFTAALVAEFHAYKWASDEAKDRPDWPNYRTLLASWGVENDAVEHARQLTEYHRWAKRYIMAEGKEERKERVVRQIMRDVEAMDTVPVTERNPSTYRAAADLLEPKKTEIHVGNKTTVNVLNVGEQEFHERLQRVKEVAARVLPNQEVPVEGTFTVLSDQADQVPRGSDHRPEEAGEAAAGGDHPAP